MPTSAAMMLWTEQIVAIKIFYNLQKGYLLKYFAQNGEKCNRSAIFRYQRVTFSLLPHGRELIIMEDNADDIIIDVFVEVDKVRKVKINYLTIQYENSKEDNMEDCLCVHNLYARINSPHKKPYN